MDDIFKDHVAQYQKKDGNVEILRWFKPGTSAYRMIYMRYETYLHVIGDVGNAIYQSGFSSLKEWSECNLDYFAGKCVASEYGAGYLVWDPECLTRRIKEILKNRKWEDFCSAKGNIALQSEHDWILWLDVHGYSFFENYPDGNNISPRCGLQLEGLSLAINQLKLLPFPPLI